MKAIGFYQYLPVDNPECLVEVDLPDPAPSDRDLLVRIKAVSVNPVDTKVRMRQESVDPVVTVSTTWSTNGLLVANLPHFHSSRLPQCR
jgi:NADPH:quinone reductase-like Zn-dependent oxidoreductase